MGRYLRAGTPLNAACPTCGEAVIGLRWCHEERCAAYERERRRRSITAALVLAVVTFVVFFALPANAQTVDPGKIQEGFVTAPIATVAFLEFLAIVYLFRELRAVERARIEDLSANFERVIAQNSGTERLTHDALESVELVEELSTEVARLKKDLENAQRILSTRST